MFKQRKKWSEERKELSKRESETNEGQKGRRKPEQFLMKRKRGKKYRKKTCIKKRGKRERGGDVRAGTV